MAKTPKVNFQDELATLAEIAQTKGRLDAVNKVIELPEDFNDVMYFEALSKRTQIPVEVLDTQGRRVKYTQNVRMLQRDKSTYDAQMLSEVTSIDKIATLGERVSGDQVGKLCIEKLHMTKKQYNDIMNQYEVEDCIVNKAYENLPQTLPSNSVGGRNYNTIDIF